MAESPPTRWDQTLWQVHTADRHRVAPTHRYWWPNRDRRPFGRIVLQLTLEGRLPYADRTGEYEAPPGHVMICRYGEASRYGYRRTPHEAYESIWLTAGGAGLGEQIDAFRAAHGSVIDCRAEPRMRQRMETVGRLADERRHVAQSPVQRAIDHLLRQPTAALSLKEVARRFGCSREHLTRCFTDQVGQSPARHIAAARLQLAMQLLRDTSLTLTEVARRAGYQSAHTLIRQVRHATGNTPSALRPGALVDIRNEPRP